MKKIILTSLALITATLFTRAQGTISLQEGKGTVITNGTSIGQGSGNAYAGKGSYYYDVLDMTETSWASLTSAQQAGADNLLVNPADLSLWTDSGVTGSNTGSLTTGGINGLGGATGSSAANWTAPTGSSYSSAGSYDYYIVVGWSANEGTSWSTVSSKIEDSTLASPGWFGESAVLYNYAGGGTLTGPNVFSPSSFTTLSGSGAGNSPGLPELVLLPVPEPATFALAGLGGLSLLFLRRRNN
jgi:hypothetical protein